jgi:hypothetical protein
MPIYGIPSSNPNPEFELGKFKTFVPRYANYVDGENGVVSTLVNSLLTPIVLLGVSNVKVDFTNDSLPKDLTVLNVNSDIDIILGKDNSCYRTGYQLNSNIEIQNNEIVDVDIKIKYFLNELISFSRTITLEVGLNEFVIENPKLVTTKAGAVLTVEIENDTLSDLDVLVFGNEVESNFIAANGPGSTLYELFCTISDNKILKNIWNSDWEFAFSYCIAHYIDLINRETQRDFGLDVQAKESTPRPLVTSINKVDYDYSTTMLDHRYAKFWQSTEFGRVLIVLLATKGIPTMMVDGASNIRGVNNGR